VTLFTTNNKQFSAAVTTFREVDTLWFSNEDRRGMNEVFMCSGQMYIRQKLSRFFYQTPLKSPRSHLMSRRWLLKQGAAAEAPSQLGWTKCLRLFVLHLVPAASALFCPVP